MQTTICSEYNKLPEIELAENILRACVHCGFCTATCPTYQLLGDELDSPRGRIYLIKQLLEGHEPSDKTQLHLDRCLTCRSCETTCPSGVRYARLLDIGRELVEKKVARAPMVTFKRWLLRVVMPFPGRFAVLLKLGRVFRPLLPRHLAEKIPKARKVRGDSPTTVRSSRVSQRKIILLQGCVQQVATPGTNRSTARVLSRLGIDVVSAAQAGCCGAVSHHLSAAEDGRDFMRRNIDAWWPHVEQGAEAIVATASGCGAMLKDYGELLADDPQYQHKAGRVSTLCKDISEVLQAESFAGAELNPFKGKIAYHSPCTLQHGQKLPGVVESLMQKAGFTLVSVADSHLCCGSAGTYSLLQPQLSQQLLHNKLENLQQDGAQVIATANVGCQLHLASKAGIPVRHWIELLDEALNGER